MSVDPKKAALTALLVGALCTVLWLAWHQWTANSSTSAIETQDLQVVRSVGGRAPGPESSASPVAPLDHTLARELGSSPRSSMAQLDPSRTLAKAARATSARELQGLAARAREAGEKELAEQLQLMEDEACGTLVRGDVGDHIDPNSEGYRRWEMFCAGAVIDPQVDNHQQRLEILDHYQAEVISALDRLLELPDWTDLDEALMQFLLETNNPIEIDAVALLLANGDIDLPADSAFLLGHRHLDALRAHMVQSASLELFSCERFGHCGPQTMQSIEACLLIADCEAGHDFLDLLRWTMAPRELDLAQQIIDLIRAFEADQGGP